MPDEQLELTPLEEIKEGIVEEEPTYEIHDEIEEPEEPVGEAPVASESVWRNDHYALGQAVGLTREEVESFGDPDAFDRVVQKFINAHEQMTGQSPDLTTPRQFEGGEGEPAKIPSGQEVDQQHEQFSFEDEEDYDDGIVKLKNYVNDHVGSLNSQIQQMHIQNNRLQAEAAGRELDAILASMDEDLFGNGRLNDVDEERGGRRIQVAQEIASMGREIVGSGETLPPLEQMAKRAADAVFGDQLRNQTLKKASKRSRKVASQAVTPPTHRESDPEKGISAAIAAAAKWQRDNGEMTAVDDAFLG
jgi:hypothetical protein